MGETAALVTAICWALSSVFFTAASKDAGSIPVNRMRLVFAVFLLLIVHTFMTGQLIPLEAESYRWFWLGLSGIVGLVLGDTFLFEAFILIGNRLGTLLMAAVPMISSLGAWMFLSEQLSLTAWLGMVLCTLGIIIVVMERNNGSTSETAHEKKRFLLGILCAIGGAAGQAGGLILAKKGLADNFPSISGVMIRMLIAMIFIWVLTILMGQAKQSLVKVFSSSKTILNITAGSIVGPFLGVWLSQIAVQLTYVGVASTLMALTPIIMLPISKWYYKENVSYRALIGTTIALAGVVIIFILLRTLSSNTLPYPLPPPAPARRRSCPKIGRKGEYFYCVFSTAAVEKTQKIKFPPPLFCPCAPHDAPGGGGQGGGCKAVGRPIPYFIF